MKSIRSAALAMIAFAAATGCMDTDSTDDSVVTDSVAMPMDSMSQMDGMSMTPARDADHEFLRMMSDHHVGLVRMSEQAATRASSATVQADARTLQTKQEAEAEDMAAMIERDYQEQYQAQAMPKHVAQTDSLSSLQGAAIDSAYYRMTIEHHRGAIVMIDEFMPRLQKPAVRTMAEEMKAEQQQEIQEFERKLDAL